MLVGSAMILLVILLAANEPVPYMPPDSGVGSYRYDQEGKVKVCCDYPYHWPERRSRRGREKRD